jgi:hypothetical protein
MNEAPKKWCRNSILNIPSLNISSTCLCVDIFLLLKL